MYRRLENDVPEQDQEQVPERGVGSKLAGAAIKGAEAALTLPLQGAYNVSNLAIGALNKLQGPLPQGEDTIHGQVDTSKLPFRSPQELLHENVVRPIAEKIGGKNVLEPHSKEEQIFQDTVQDLAALYDPANFIKKGITAGKAALQVGANAVNWLAQSVGFSEETGEAAKLGTVLLGTFFGKDTINGYKKKQYDIAKSVPENTYVKAPEAVNKLKTIQTKLGNRNFKGKDIVKGFIDTQLDAVKNGNEIDFQQLINSKEDANSWFGKLDSIAREQMSEINRITKQVIKDAPKNVINKNMRSIVDKSSKALLSADAINTAQAVSDNAQNAFTKGARWGSYLSSVPALLFGGPKLAGLGLAAGAVQTGSNLFKFVTKNPEVRKAYANIFKELGRNNKEAALKYLARIDKIAAQEGPEEFKVNNGEYNRLN